MRVFLIGLFFLLPTFAWAGEITIATFNAEFLIRSKVHIKFGLPLNLTAPEQATWNAPGFRNAEFAEAAAAVASAIAAINADVIVLNEVGDEADVDELNVAVAAAGVTYHRSLAFWLSAWSLAGPT